MLELLKYANVLMRSAVASLPTYVVLFVTARCNLKCKMCFYWRRIENANGSVELNLGEIEVISRSFGYIANLAVSGGEPFLRDDLDQICYIFYKNNGLRFMNIPTNGSMPERVEFITEKILNVCKKATVAIELSLDGIEGTHDFIRGVSGSFRNLIATYGRLCKLKRKFSNLWLKVNTTFSSYNQDHMDEIMRYVEENMNVDDFYIAMLHGMPRDPMAGSFSLDKYIKYISLLEAKGSSSKNNLLGRLLFTVRKILTEEIINVMRTGRFNSPCTALRKIIVLDEIGNVFPCETITETLGNLRDFDYDIKKIIYSKRRYEFEKRYKITSGCNCNWGCAIFNNIIYDLKRWPFFVKNLFLAS